MDTSLFTKYEVKEKTKTSERAELVGNIYEIYISPQERINRKKDNWKRYIVWLKENRTPHSIEKVQEFKKHKRFIKELPIKTFCYFISHIPTKDLYYLLSQAKDMQNRDQNFSKYLMGSLKPK